MASPEGRPPGTVPVASPAVPLRFHSPRILALLGLGFASGLPISLTSTSLQAWLYDHGLSIHAIGASTWVGLPYLLKFLWAPLLDRYVPPLLGRRRGWMLLAQLALVVAILGYHWLDPSRQSHAVVVLAMSLAFFSATQDIAVDAYRADLLQPAERGLGAAAYLTGYRVAMIISGALALVMADRIGWPAVFQVLALLMLGTTLITWWAPEPVTTSDRPHSLRAAVVEPLAEFLQRRQAVLLLFLIFSYKFGDALALALSTPFLRQIGFSNHEIGYVSKGFGLAATLVGVWIGGALVSRIGLYRALLWTGVAQALTILAYAAQARAGNEPLVLVVTIALQSLGDGMGTAAFAALLAALCNARFSAFQYALFSAIFSLGRVAFGGLAGQVAERVGWVDYFSICSSVALGALLLLPVVRSSILSADRLNGEQAA